MAAGDKTEKATPKKLKDARKKGQVARSMDLNGAIVLLAALMGLSAFGPMMYARMAEAMVAVLALTRSPGVVNTSGIGWLLTEVGVHVGVAAAPVVVISAIAGVVVNVAQVGLQPAPQ